MQSQRSPVGTEMTVEVVAKQTSELVSALDVGARVNHVTTWEGLIKSGVVSAIQLVHDDFPDGVRTGRAVVRVTVALVGHTEVESVRPDGNTSQGSGDRGIVHKELIGHHFELFVSTDAQVRSPHSDDGAVADVGEPFDDESGTGHLS